MAGEMVKVPDKIMTRGGQLAKEIRVFGHRLDELTKDQLIAVAAFGWNSARQIHEQHLKTRKALVDLINAKRN